MYSYYTRILLVQANRPIPNFLQQIVWNILLKHDVKILMIRLIESEQLWYKIV